VTDDSEVIRMQEMYSQLRVLRRHVDLLRVSSALCPGVLPAF
jgi:hypothetical protein